MAIRGSEIRAWPLQKGMGNYRQTSFIGHESAVSTMVFIPDGRRIISGATDGTIKIWSRDNKQRAKLHLGASSIKYLAGNENPLEIVAGDGRVENRISTNPLRVGSKVNAVRSFINGTDGGWTSLRLNEDFELEIVRSDRDPGQETVLVSTGRESFDDMIFSADATGRFATIAPLILDREENEDFHFPLTLYDLESGKQIAKLVETSAKRQSVEFGATSFSDDGGIVVVAFDSFDEDLAPSSLVEVWDTDSLEKVATLRLSGCLLYTSDAADE